jgi:hypothetical protein
VRLVDGDDEAEAALNPTTPAATTALRNRNAACPTWACRRFELLAPRVTTIHLRCRPVTEPYRSKMLGSERQRTLKSEQCKAQSDTLSQHRHLRARAL